MYETFGKVENSILYGFSSPSITSSHYAFSSAILCSSSSLSLLTIRSTRCFLREMILLNQCYRYYLYYLRHLCFSNLVHIIVVNIKFKLVCIADNIIIVNEIFFRLVLRHILWFQCDNKINSIIL